MVACKCTVEQSTLRRKPMQRACFHGCFYMAPLLFALDHIMQWPGNLDAHGRSGAPLVQPCDMLQHQHESSHTRRCRLRSRRGKLALRDIFWIVRAVVPDRILWGDVATWTSYTRASRSFYLVSGLLQESSQQRRYASEECLPYPMRQPGLNRPAYSQMQLTRR
jgi:hypothetical protein